MGKKKNGNKKGGGGEKKEKVSLSIVVYVSCLCDGCTPKILKYIHQVEGVETAKVERSSNEVTVIGAVDPKAIVEKLRKETKKKIELISPQPKKVENKEEKKQKDDKNDGGEDDGGGKGKKKKNKDGNGGGDGGNEANADGATMEYVVQPEFGYMPGYPGYLHGYLGYGHPGYEYSSGHSHPHGRGYGHAYPGYVPGYSLSLHPPQQMFNN
ncbi:hypothetical protein DITRI_Ditri05aG0012800 [Diplodiscus trichospermus]